MNYEQNKQVAERPWLKTPLFLVAAGLTALTLSGCGSGQKTPPTPNEVQEGAEYFYLEDVIAEDGSPVECVMYASDTSATNQSKSWFGFSCDFVGTAKFPGESK